MQSLFKKRFLSSLILSVFTLLLSQLMASADGMLLPPLTDYSRSAPLAYRQVFSVKYHHVNVEIDSQSAVTSVDQVFHNETARDTEGTYIFPMIEGAAINRFSMYDGDREIEGKVLDKDSAREIYESIVRKAQDPALLEYVGLNMFKARVYPIPANGDKRIKLQYSEVLNKEAGLVKYVYPLSTEQFSAKPLQDVSITLHIKSRQPIANIYSPSHEIDVKQTTPTEATVVWKGSNITPDRDLVLYYSVSDQNLPIQVISHHEPSEPGYFMLLASPKVTEDIKPLPKQIVFVIDRTGSMSGEKIEQAKKALKYCIHQLKPSDRFNVIMFNEDTEWFKTGLTLATRENIAAAVKMVDGIDARGGTNIDKALRVALSQYPATFDQTKGNPYIVFLTDGLPTVGITDTNTIIKNVRTENKKDCAIFAFGVGDDVNAKFLDMLTQEHHADADYVRPEENIEVRVTAFFDKVSSPILTDLRLTATGVRTLDSYPSSPLPDLFKGSQLIVIGRYNGAGEATFTLSGKAAGRAKTFKETVFLPAAQADNEFIPRLWASRKIGYLMDEIRLHNTNSELIAEIVRLSKEFGIPTEFTSFLADEREDLPDKVAEDRAKQAFESASKADSGSWSVTQSSNARSLRNQSTVSGTLQRDSYVGNVASAPAAAGGSNSYNGSGFGTTNSFVDATGRTVQVNNIQNVGTRTFYNRNNRWVDARYESQNAIKIKSFSRAHFQLLEANPELKQYSKLGEVTVVINGNAVEIGSDGKDILTAEELKSISNKS